MCYEIIIKFDSSEESKCFLSDMDIMHPNEYSIDESYGNVKKNFTYSFHQM